MATIHIDGKKYTVDGGDNLLHACLSLGLDVPYFCWHPALGSVGACRQCAVKQFRDENDKQGKLVMSCMTGSADGTFISISDPEAKAFRESVVEWLMTNHPHDCPVCEEGGHCHLQDMTVMTGHSKRRYRFSKRTHQNQDLGPFISHEMNRCIACYRCTRYYKDYADGQDFGVYGVASNVYFGRPENGAFESEFSGNLVEVCPTGVFTDKTHSERYNRKWDMQFAPSICQGCALGCNISPGERYGELRRIENRYNGSVNNYFLCDRGRFGYGYVNRKDRPRQPLARHGGELSVVTTETALARAGEELRHASRIIGIGSPRASLEANFALRELVGADNFSSGIAAGELEQLNLIVQLMEQGPAHTPSLREVEACDAVLIIGEDVTQTAPRLALSIRQAAKGGARKLAADKHIAGWQAEAIQNIGRSEKYPVFIATVDETRLDDTAKTVYRAAPEDLSRLGFAVANAIDPAAPVVAGLDEMVSTLAKSIADALLAAAKPLIVTGTGAGSIALIQAVGNISLALHARGKTCALSFALAESNSLGVAMLLAGALEPALETLKNGEADALIVLENDLYRRADATLVDAALANAKTLVVLDHQAQPTLAKASFALPAASFAEGDGTLVSSEGRAQRFFQVYDPVYYDAACQIRESWRWLHALNAATHAKPISWTQLDHATHELARGIPRLARVVDAAPAASFRMQGMKIAREPHRYSGRTAMRANISVHEPRAPQDQDTALAFSMEGHNGTQAGNRPGALIPFAWAPGWNSPQAWNKFQDEVGGAIREGDPGVRLFENGTGGGEYFSTIPEAFAPAQGAWRVLPLYHLFGSEELSVRAAPVASRLPAPYAALSPEDARSLGVSAAGRIDVWLPGGTLSLPVTIRESLPVGTVGLPSGLPGIPSWADGLRVQLSLAVVDAA